MAAPRTLLLVDANHLLHRVMRQPATVELKFAGTFGFLRCLRNAMERYPYRQCIACWDGGLSARRLQLLPTYKHRTDRGDEAEAEEYRARFKLNRAYLHRLLPLLGVVDLKLAGREADDIVFQARLAAQRLADAAALPVGAVVISEDRDFLQMVNDDTDIYQPRHDRYVTTSSFVPIVKLLPERFLLFKSVLGDAGDNVPGIKSVGEVTAFQIASEGPIAPEREPGPPQWDDVPAWCAAHENRRVRAVAPAWDTVLLNYELVAFAREAFEREELDRIRAAIESPPPVNQDGAYELMDALQFASLLHGFANWIVPFRRLDSGPCFRRLP